MNKMTDKLSEFVLFSEEEIRALDERSFEKNVRGKPATCITCLWGIHLTGLDAG